jgi:hypothetical protein
MIDDINARNNELSNQRSTHTSLMVPTHKTPINSTHVDWLADCQEQQELKKEHQEMKKWRHIRQTDEDDEHENNIDARHIRCKKVARMTNQSEIKPFGSTSPLKDHGTVASKLAPAVKETS